MPAGERRGCSGRCHPLQPRRAAAARVRASAAARVRASAAARVRAGLAAGKGQGGAGGGGASASNPYGDFAPYRDGGAPYATCSECGLDKGEESFSKTQWKRKSGRRCTQCISGGGGGGGDGGGGGGGRRRVAPDGVRYTRQEFVDYYGGTDEWNEAAAGGGGGGGGQGQGQRQGGGQGQGGDVTAAGERAKIWGPGEAAKHRRWVQPGTAGRDDDGWRDAGDYLTELGIGDEAAAYGDWVLNVIDRFTKAHHYWSRALRNKLRFYVGARGGAGGTMGGMVGRMTRRARQAGGPGEDWVYFTYLIATGLPDPQAMQPTFRTARPPVDAVAGTLSPQAFMYGPVVVYFSRIAAGGMNPILYERELLAWLYPWSNQRMGRNNQSLLAWYLRRGGTSGGEEFWANWGNPNLPEEQQGGPPETWDFPVPNRGDVQYDHLRQVFAGWSGQQRTWRGWRFPPA